MGKGMNVFGDSNSYIMKISITKPEARALLALFDAHSMSFREDHPEHEKHLLSVLPKIETATYQKPLEKNSISIP